MLENVLITPALFLSFFHDSRGLIIKVCKNYQEFIDTCIWYLQENTDKEHAINQTIELMERLETSHQLTDIGRTI